MGCLWSSNEVYPYDSEDSEDSKFSDSQSISEIKRLNKEQSDKLLSKRQQRLIGSTCVSKPNNTQRKKTSLS